LVSSPQKEPRRVFGFTFCLCLSSPSFLGISAYERIDAGVEEEDFSDCYGDGGKNEYCHGVYCYPSSSLKLSSLRINLRRDRNNPPEIGAGARRYMTVNTSAIAGALEHDWNRYRLVNVSLPKSLARLPGNSILHPLKAHSDSLGDANTLKNGSSSLFGMRPDCHPTH